MGRRIGLGACAVALGALATGCVGAGAFDCQTDTMCNGGRCELTGWCSFPDGECISGQRYGELAGGGFAGMCVPVMGTDDGTGSSPGTLSTTGTGPTLTTLPSSSADPSSSGDPSVGPSSGSVSGPDPLCGNGQPNAGEDCDDGNEADGDGCDADCTLSGETIWTEVIDTMGSQDAYRDVVILPNGDLAVGGEAFGDEPIVDIYAFDDGTLTTSTQLSAPFGGNVWGVDVGGDYLIAGGASVDGMDEGFLSILDANGNELDAVVVAARVFDVAVDFETPGPFLVVGDAAGAPAGIGFDTQGAMVFDIASALPETGVAWDGARTQGVGYIGGTLGTDPFLHAVDLMGPLWELTFDEVSSGAIYGVTMSPMGDLVVSGAVQDFDDRFLGIVAVVTIDGDVTWEARLESETGDFANIHKAAGGPAGEVVGVGWVHRDADNADIWVGKYDSTGDLLWERFFAGDSDGDSNGWGVTVHDDGSITAVGALRNETYDAWIAHLEP